MHVEGKTKAAHSSTILPLEADKFHSALKDANTGGLEAKRPVSIREAVSSTEASADLMAPPRLPNELIGEILCWVDTQTLRVCERLSKSMKVDLISRGVNSPWHVACKRDFGCEKTDKMIAALTIPNNTISAFTAPPAKQIYFKLKNEEIRQEIVQWHDEQCARISELHYQSPGYEGTPQEDGALKKKLEKIWELASELLRCRTGGTEI